MKFRLGEVLHKTLAEIEAMSVSEFHHWVAYFSHRWKK